MPPPLVIHVALVLSGLFTTTLGLAHFTFPQRLDFDHAIPRDGAPLKPFRLGPIHYATRRGDVLGIALVMNHAASYVLTSLGLVDLWAAWHGWPRTALGQGFAMWVAGWWLLRAGSQLYLGRRPGDLWILLGFAGLGVLHLALAFP